MKLHTLKYIVASFCALSLVVACSDDDNGPIVQASCSDGIMNGTETAVDCGGSSCQPCDDAMEPMEPMEPEALDFSGTYAQVDFMGRPGINTVLSADDATKELHNVSIPSEGAASFQAGFEARLIALHAAYGAEYETNILGLDAAGIIGVLAADVLEVSPTLPTTYFNPGEDNNDDDDNPLTLDGDEVALTGRAIGDDVIDVSLILLFGGESGMRFSGQDTNGDGEADLPRLTSDGVAITAEPTDTFPYLGAPE